MRTFRLLRPEEIECRVARSNDKGVTLLLYKTARTDYALFDETFGVMNWQCKYELINGVMYCGIGVYCEDRGDWVWKWNCGTESNTEAEKGQASDAIKRAGFTWGCGTELYSSPFIWIPADKVKIFNGKVADDFTVTRIGYDKDGNVNQLEIINKEKKVVFQMGTGKAATKEEPKKEEPKPLPKYVCSNCNGEITGVKSGGKVVTAEEIAARTQKVYGKMLCTKCAKAATNASHEG